MYLYGKMAITTIVLLYTTRLVLNALGGIDYGVFGIVGGVIAMLGFLNTAMASTTQRFFSYAEGEGRADHLVALFNNTIILHFIIGLLIFGIIEIMYYPLFNGILNIPIERIFAAKCIYHFMAISTMFTIMTVPYDAMINAHEDLIYYSVIGIVEAFLKLGVAFFIIYTTRDKLILYGLLMAIISLMMMMVMRFYCYKHYKECVFKPKLYYDKSIIREIGIFASWNFIGVFSSIMGNYGSTILLNHFFGTIVIAAKTISDQIGGQLLVLSNNMSKALNPSIIKAAGRKEQSDMLKLSLNGCRFSFLLYSFLAIPFLVESHFILRVWLNKLPEWTVVFCQFQVVRVMLEQLSVSLRISIMAEGSVKPMNLVNLIEGVITFISLYVIYLAGGNVYWHFIMSILFMVIVESIYKIYLCREKCGLDVKTYINDVLLKSIICVIPPLLLGGIIVSCINEGVLRFCISCFVCSITLLLTSFAYGIQNNERMYIILSLKSLLKGRNNIK